MPRVKRGTATKARHKRSLRAAKGYQKTRNRLVKKASRLDVKDLLEIAAMKGVSASREPTADTPPDDASAEPAGTTASSSASST